MYVPEVFFSLNILDTDPLRIMERLVMMAVHMAKAVEVDQFEAIVENIHNFFLREASEIKGDALNLLGDLTYNIIFISQLSGSLAWGRVGCES